jgi:hypothetical protein
MRTLSYLNSDFPAKTNAQAKRSQRLRKPGTSATQATCSVCLGPGYSRPPAPAPGIRTSLSGPGKVDSGSASYSSTPPKYSVGSSAMLSCRRYARLYSTLTAAKPGAGMETGSPSW